MLQQRTFLLPTIFGIVLRVQKYLASPPRDLVRLLAVTARVKCDILVSSFVLVHADLIKPDGDA